MAALSVAGLLCANAYAAETSYDWRAKGRNIPGAPTSVTSVPDEFYVKHGRAGATAAMKGITHT